MMEAGRHTSSSILCLPSEEKQRVRDPEGAAMPLINSSLSIGKKQARQRQMQRQCRREVLVRKLFGGAKHQSRKSEVVEEGRQGKVCLKNLFEGP